MSSCKNNLLSYKNGRLEQFVLGPTYHEPLHAIILASSVLGRSATERLIVEVLTVSAVYCACCMQLAPAPIDHFGLSGCRKQDNQLMMCPTC
jgi:hypothetical protein